jgi:hypothetical protein
MRNLVLLLLLLNFLAFTYQSWILEPDVRLEATYIEQDFPGLMVAEASVSPVTSIILPKVVASDDKVGYRCIRVGPFPREADADTARHALQSSVASVRQTTEKGQVWVGHWVQVADQGSRSGAEAARDALVAVGIQDAYILPGENDYRISLGVFRLRSSANRMMEQASKLGLDTRVDDRFQPGTNFWLQVRLSGDRTVRPNEIRTDTGQILRTETASCTAADI